jgi:16S rRNA (guanine527-N7)-methyltransferase
MTSSRPEVPYWLDVSRETIDQLALFKGLVEKWNHAINLVAKGQEAEIWSRHILDSAQLIQSMPVNAKKWCDLGSGGGFPGIVIAVIAKAHFANVRVSLVESDKRKAVFLTQAARELGLDVKVESCRIEELAPQEADVVSARALSSLSDLLALTQRHLKRDGTAIFPKGLSADREIELARQEWNFTVNECPSHTSEQGKILVLKDIEHV